LITNMNVRTASAPVSWLRPKYFVFAFIFAMMAYVFHHNERFLINASDPAWEHYGVFKWWLLPHGVGAGCALLLGPLQFSDRLRKRYTKLHRVLGRFYVGGVLLGAPIGAYIQYRFDELVFGASRSFTIATIVDALILMATTVIALSFAMRGKIQLHRQWMTRSYAVAIVFLEVRVIGGLGGWDDNLRVTEMIVWTCIAMSLLFADVVIHWQELRSSRPAAAKAMAAVGAD
jgi:uncharacterized membrane protein